MRLLKFGLLLFSINSFGLTCSELFSPAKSVDELLRSYVATREVPRNQKTKQYFDGLRPKYDVYNPTAPFWSINKRGNSVEVIAGRVEHESKETGSKVMFFVRNPRKTNHWMPLDGAPIMNLQDPFVTTIDGEIIFGGVEIVEVNGKLKYRTAFFRGSSVFNLKRFAAGPWGMKDIRLSQLSDGQIVVVTRPQGEFEAIDKNGKRKIIKGGRGKIGYTIISDLNELKNLENIKNAELVHDLFLDSEWGGANQLKTLKNDMIGVIGHIAKFDEAGKRHYYGISFVLNPFTGEVSDLQIIFIREDLENGLFGKTKIVNLDKKDDLQDIVFPSGFDLVMDVSEEWITITCGSGDAEVHQIRIKNPFYRK